MIQFQQICKSFGKQRVLHEATFVIRSGERVGVVGPNGAGKSTIFELLTGNCMADSGTVGIPSALRIGHVRQQLNPHGTDDSLLDYAESALPELYAIEQEIHGIEHRLAEGGAGDPSALRRLGDLQTAFEHLGGYELRARAEAILCGLGFDPAALGDPFRSFSGGWQIRAELARVLVSEPDILLLDEPTNYLDVIAVEWLYDFLRSFSGTLALVSHDRYLLNRLTQITLEVSGGMVTRYVGNYEQYVATREERYRQLLAAKSNQDRKREKLEQFVERFRAKATKASQAQSRMKMLDRFEEVHVPQIAIRAPRIVLPPPPRCGGEVVRLEDAGFSYDDTRWIFEKVSMRLDRGEKAAIVGLNGMGKTTLLRTLAGKL
ncbi:MAG: ABC-F family ATP-binding cassette domain-containing protein, partial [Lentisphaeria bacterium]|nr:ABC-F family ATP-binding cassette domain-containing protein [Lentisphaeria bacterium]